MGRKSYESYDYIDPDYLYTYKDSSVLINKFNEKNAIKARELEYQLVASQSLKLFLHPIEVHSVSDILKIHRYLFGDIYSWAGYYRKVNISKSGDAFMPIQSFDMAEKYLNRLLFEFHDRANSKQDIIKSLADILDNLNYFHPFREGNGRVQRLYFRQLARWIGHSLNFAAIDSDRMMIATIHASAGIMDGLQQIFDEMLD